jgi:membrane protein YdbS with pleckstrin-like domain
MTKPIVAVALRSIVIIMIILSPMVVAQIAVYWRGLDPPWLSWAGALIVHGDSLRKSRIIGLIG